MFGAVVNQVQKQGRVTRKPVPQFQCGNPPLQIQPVMIAPVLAGETLNNLLLQSRVVTMPLKNPLIGWWKEYYFFYVKLRDMVFRDDFMDMLIDPNKSMSGRYEAANLKHYHRANRINWTKHCLEVVTNEYFRAEGRHMRLLRRCLILCRWSLLTGMVSRIARCLIRLIFDRT